MNREWLRAPRRAAIATLSLLLFSCRAFAAGPQATPSIFAPASTPATDISHLAYFVLSIVAGIFIVVGGLLTFVVIRYRDRDSNDKREPAQIYGSNQIELAWTVIPILIVVVLFLTTARMIFAIQDAPKPPSALNVTVVGHQFWWEFRYPELGIVTANEMHVPLSSHQEPRPTYLKLLSADVVHSFWVPQLAGKTDVIPNHPNLTWIDPQHPGVYVGQCAQFCGVQHAKMLLRVYVDTPEQFADWVKNQQEPGVQDPAVAAGRRIFETQACMNCHTIRGTAATGRFGPDLTHLMSRDTLASGAAPLNKQTLRQWIEEPDSIKPGSLMPAMKLSDQQLDELTAYLSTLK